MVNEQQIEYGFIGDLQRLKYTSRPDIRDRAALEANFREKFEALNRVRLSDAEFSRLRDEIVNPDVFLASKTLRGRNAFIREDGTPLNYTLVNIKEWCKNDFEVVSHAHRHREKPPPLRCHPVYQRHPGGAVGAKNAGSVAAPCHAANRGLQG